MTKEINTDNVIGHRVAGNHAPINSKEAFQTASDMGLKWVEFDSRITSDNHLVLAYSNKLFDPQTGERKLISESTLDEVKDMAERGFLQKNPRGIPLSFVPLEDALTDCVARNLRPQIEMKIDSTEVQPHQTEGMAKALSDTLNDPVTNFSKKLQPLVTSFNSDCLTAFQSFDNRETETGLLIFFEKTDEWQKIADKVKPDYVHFFGGMNEGQIENLLPIYGPEATKAGYKVNAYIVNSPEHAQAAIKGGAQRFTSDEPEKLLGTPTHSAPRQSKRNNDMSEQDATSESLPSVVNTVIIPAAGKGTRMGHPTKAIPKPLLPLGDKPLVMHAIDEAMESGATDIVILCRPEHTALFQQQIDASYPSANTGKRKLRAVSDPTAGGGPALGIAHYLQDKEPMAFGVILPDDIFLAAPPVTKRLFDDFAQTGMTTIGVRKIDMEHEQPKNVTFMTANEVDGGRFMSSQIQIKPKEDKPISDNGTCGRYVFGPDYMDAFEACNDGKSPEVSMSAIVKHITENEGVGVVHLNKNAKFFDCGDMTGFHFAVCHFAPMEILSQVFEERANKSEPYKALKTNLSLPIAEPEDP
tara:strand:- start:376 stop:2127 length:1752 start_codon:yes stop_codon:yes gene_type:complete